MLLFALIIALIIAELVARWFYGDDWRIAPISAEHRFWQRDQILGWSPVPGSEGRFRNLYAGYDGEVRFDAMGIRVNDNPEIESGLKTLLLLGDSTTAGLEVDNDQTYAAILERLLRENGCGYRVLNAGVRGYGTDQALWRYQQLAATVKPDFTLYLYTGNDPVNNRTLKRSGRHYAKPVVVLRADGLHVRPLPVGAWPMDYYAYINYGAAGPVVNEGRSGINHPLLAAMDRYLSDRVAAYFPLHRLLEGWREQINNRLAYSGAVATNNDVDQQLLTRLMARMWQVTEGRLAVAQHAVNPIRHPSQPERAALAAGVPFVTIDEFFTRPHAEYHWRGDFHWNQTGHHQAATALMQKLGPQLCAQS